MSRRTLPRTAARHKPQGDTGPAPRAAYSQPMTDPVLSFTDRGIYCPAGDFHIDPWRPVARALITHGHADHARPDDVIELPTPFARDQLHNGRALLLVSFSAFASSTTRGTRGAARPKEDQPGEGLPEHGDEAA